MLETEEFGPVTQIKMGREMDGRVLYRVAAYLVDDLLIDTGCLHTAEELLNYLKDKNVRRVFVTHYHEDHIGGAALLQQELGLNVWAPPRSIPLIAKTPKLYPYQELVWGYPDPFEALPVAENELRADHFRLEMVEAPGHSEDHVVLVEPFKGWCFSGDLFVSEKIKVLRPEEDIGKVMQSMQNLLHLEHELILFTSIGRIEPEGKEALKNCLSHLENLGREAKRLQREEHLSEGQIVERLFGGESALADLTNGQFAAGHLVTSLLKS